MWLAAGGQIAEEKASALTLDRIFQKELQECKRSLHALFRNKSYRPHASLSSSGCFSLLPWLLFSASLALFFMAVFVPLPGATIFLFWTCISLIKRTCSHSLHTLFFCLTLPSLTHCLLWLTMLLKPSSQTHSFSQAISVHTREKMLNSLCYWSGTLNTAAKPLTVTCRNTQGKYITPISFS